MDITTFGIDLAKSVFQLHGIDELVAVVVKKANQTPSDGGILC